MEIILKNTPFTLLPAKALYKPDEKLLVIADVHLGKAKHFLKAGINIPAASQQKDYNTLAQLFLNIEPRKVYFLGDLFHSNINTDWMRFETLVNAFSYIKFTLIKGNHDLISEGLYQALNVCVVHECVEVDQFIYSHQPLKNADADKINIAGHIHPAVTLNGKARQSVKLPCFCLSGNCLLLPSFGNLTGAYVIDYTKEDAVYVVMKEHVEQLF